MISTFDNLLAGIWRCQLLTLTMAHHSLIHRCNPSNSPFSKIAETFCLGLFPISNEIRTNGQWYHFILVTRCDRRQNFLHTFLFCFMINRSAVKYVQWIVQISITHCVSLQVRRAIVDNGLTKSVMQSTGSWANMWLSCGFPENLQSNSALLPSPY